MFHICFKVPPFSIYFNLLLNVCALLVVHIGFSETRDKMVGFSDPSVCCRVGFFANCEIETSDFRIRLHFDVKLADFPDAKFGRIFGFLKKIDRGA
jgi:hypothetical protein